MWIICVQWSLALSLNQLWFLAIRKRAHRWMSISTNWRTSVRNRKRWRALVTRLSGKQWKRKHWANRICLSVCCSGVHRTLSASCWRVVKCHSFARMWRCCLMSFRSFVHGWNAIHLRWSRMLPLGLICWKFCAILWRILVLSCTFVNCLLRCTPSSLSAIRECFVSCWIKTG